MSQIPYPTINDPQGLATHVVMPIDEYRRLTRQPGEGYTHIPSEVAEKVLDDVSPLRAWREYKGLTQAAMAKGMDVSAPAYCQMEQAGKPHRATLEKAAAVLGIELPQLLELYDDEPVSTPDGPEMI